MGKNLKPEDLVLNIIINGDKGVKELNELERAVGDSRKELVKLQDKQAQMDKAGKTSGKRYHNLTDKIKEHESAIAMANTRMDDLRNGMTLSGMSINDLKKRVSGLNAAIKNVKPGTAEWKAYRKELRETSLRLQYLEKDAKSIDSGLCKMSGTINKYAGVIGLGIAAVTGAISGMDRLREKYLAYDDQLADVMKTTQLSKEAAEGLNKELLAIDTRTVQEQLLDLSRIAGKMGETDAQSIREFTEAADVINVALGGDLGGDVEETIGMVAKLTDLFGAKKEFGIGPSLLKVASAVNTLGASSTANEEYIVRFASRMGGIGAMAKMPIDDVLGLAATMDALGQRSEISTTAVARVVSGMFTDTERYAQVAGMSMTDFAALLESDVSGAFMRVLKGINGDGGLRSVLESLQEVGIDGTEASGVLSALAGNTEMLAAQQEISNKAFREGTSVLDEFNVKNNTDAAIREKKRKEMNAAAIELGRELNFLGDGATSVGAFFMKSIAVSVRWAKENKEALWSLSGALTLLILQIKGLKGEAIAKWFKSAKVAIVGFTARVKAAFVGVKSFSGALKLMKAAFLSTPLGWITTALTLIGTAFILLKKKVDDVTSAQKAMNDINAKTKELVADEVGELRSLLAIVSDKNIADEERLVAMKKLQDLIPDGVKLINEETIATGKATGAVEEHIKALTARARVEAAYERLKELEKEELALDDPDNERIAPTGWQKVKAFMNSNNMPSAVNYITYDSNIAGYIEENKKKALSDIEAQKTAVLAMIAKNSVLPTTTTVIPNPNGTGGDGGTGGNPVNAKDDLYHQERLSIKKRFLEGSIATQDEYNRLLEQAQIDSYQRLLANDKLSSEQRLSIEEKLYEYRITLRSKEFSEAEQSNKLFRDLTETQIEAEKRVYQEKIDGINKSLLKEDQKVLAIEVLTKQHYDRMNTLQEKAYSDEVSKKQARFENDLSALRYQHRIALSEFEGTKQEKKAMEAAFANEERDFIIKHLQGLSGDLQGILADGRFPGIADALLSEDQKQKLIKRLRDIGIEILDLKGKQEGDDKSDALTKEEGDIDILGIKSSDWETAINRIKEMGRVGKEEILMSAKALSNGLAQYNKMATAMEERQMKTFEKDSKKKRKVLDQQLASGIISRENYDSQILALDEEMDRKHQQIELKQAKRDKTQAIIDAIINTAVEITKVASRPLKVAAVAALGAVQVATIAAQPLPGKEEGGYLTVEREQDGKKFNAVYDPSKRGFVSRPTVVTGVLGQDYLTAEGGPEYVIPTEGVANPTIYPLIATIENARRTGCLKSINMNKVIPGRQEGGSLSRTSLPEGNAPSGSTNDAEISRLYQMMDENKEVMNRLSMRLDKGIPAFVCLSGPRGLDEQLKRYNKAKKQVAI